MINKFTPQLRPIHRAVKRLFSISHSDFPEHRSLVIESYGEPTENVILQTKNPQQVLPNELGPSQVLLDHLVSCINPADINLIQGIYGKKPKLPSIVGGEGLMKVRSVGRDVKHLKQGDLALAVSLIGNWQNYSVQDANDIFRVDPDLEWTTASQLKVNPCTAYRMIKDFVTLKPGDVIIQNGANSAVGVYVIQLAKLWGFNTINVIRDRPNKDQVINELVDFGADYVLTESEVSSIEVMKPILSKVGKPKLLLNCVGGKNAMNCQRMLDHGGYSVTYGAMSKQPFSPSASALIFKDHKYVGFWVSHWYQVRESFERRHEISSMLDELGQLFKRNVLRPKPTTLIGFEDRNVAFTSSNNTKYLFSINKQ